MTIDLEPRVDTLPEDLNKAFILWQSSKPNTPIERDSASNLNTLLRSCAEQRISITCVVSKDTIGKGKKRDMRLVTAMKNGRLIPDGNFSFTTVGRKSLVFHAAGDRHLKIKRVNEKGHNIEIGSFHKDKIVSLNISPIQHLEATVTEKCKFRKFIGKLVIVN